jgi:hypothetical protein
MEIIDSLSGAGNSDQPQKFNRHLTRPGRRYVLVEQNGFADLVADGVHGRKGAHRLLKDHGDILAPDTANF